ncbi:DUF3631 domain-containing protein [Leeia sp. TBRC 13508]|uniref:DUF3631 domain-containing protein n=1 Tax=Leeia speluncae TaxID=2884804 RepID=A0ABS8D459_9NEIS|nr:DUF3631 domain-containing protein [Leeia speluncae]MCB6182975.1 DUF3631 domain-containing protein [Leeia speluncae]
MEYVDDKTLSLFGDDTPAQADAAPALPSLPMLDVAATPPVNALDVESDDQTIERLASLSELQYERVREAAAAKIAIRPTILDKLVRAKRKEHEAANSTDKGQAVEFDDPMPCLLPVDGDELLTDVCQTIRRYIICDQETAIAASLWVCMTWLIDHVSIAPIANITAPERNCGKSEMLAMLGKLSRRAMTVSNISPAALYRAVEKWRPTLLIDEADASADNNEDLRGLLNSGHTRDSAYVLRVVGDELEPRRFSTWGAKAIAGIGKRAGTIESRSIPLAMRRKLPHETTERRRSKQAEAFFLDLKSRIARWTEDNAEQITNVLPSIPNGLNNRTADNWEPLLAIADAAGAGWSDKARKAALKLSGVEDAPSVDQELLADIRDIFADKDADKISSKDLIDALVSDDEKMWRTYNRGREMTPKQLVNRLKSFGIGSSVLRIGFSTARGYRKDDFEDAFKRYLPDVTLPNVTLLQPSNHAGCSDFAHVTSKNHVTHEKRLEASIHTGCYDVTHRTSQNSEMGKSYANTAPANAPQMTLQATGTDGIEVDL